MSGNIRTLALLFSLSLVLCSFLCGCSKEKDEKGQERRVSFNGKTQVVEKSKVPVLAVFPGRIRSKVQVILAAKMGGYVKDVPVQIGDEVEANELLVAIDDTDVRSRIDSLYAQRKAIKSELEAIEARYEYSKINFERFNKLYQEESATKDELDRARTEYEALKGQVQAIKSRITSIDARLKEARNQLSYLVIKAPLSGWVSDRKVDAGTYVNPGQPLIRLDGKGVGFWFQANVDDRLFGKVKPGDKVTVVIPSMGKSMEAKVAHIQESSNPATNTFTLLVDIEEQGLKSGLFGRVIITLSEKSQVVLPQDVIVKRAGIDGVYVVDEHGVIHWRIIRLGRKWLRKNGRFFPRLDSLAADSDKDTKFFVTVLSGVSPGEKIVVSNLSQAREGARLE